MKKLFLSFLTVMMAVFCVVAQNKTVSGTVLSASDDEPLSGATIRVVGTTLGVSADIDGNFTVSAPQSAKQIEVTYVGYEGKVVDITPGHMVIKLRDNQQLDEVIVVAYGTMKKSEYTGAASVVKADQLEDALVSDATSALAGKVSGVQILSSNGQPGSSPSVRIRGVGTINGSATPLYVVDGMPFEGDIASLNTQDIESMTVLKDAASTALYGARGANGVILITTKSGKVGEAKITFDARWGSNSRQVPMYRTVNQKQYMETVYQSIYNWAIRATDDKGNLKYNANSAHLYANETLWNGLGYQTWSVPQGELFIGSNGKFNPNATPGYSDGQYYYVGDDWIDESTINGMRQEYSLSISGGSDKINYYLSAAYLEDEGLIAGSHFNRLSTRAAVEYQAKKWLKLTANLNYTYTNSGYPDGQVDNSSGSDNLFYVAGSMAPIYPIYVRDAEGHIMYNDVYGLPIYDYGDAKSTNRARAFMSQANPAGSLRYDKEDYLSDIFDGKWAAIITPIEGLTLNGTIGYRADNTRMHYIANPLYGQTAAYGGQAMQALQRFRNINILGTATYARTFNKVHNAELMVGYESTDYNVEVIQAIGSNLYNPSSWAVNNTIDNLRGSGYAQTLAHRGIFGRAKYNYDGRFFFMFSYRRDASSRFAPDVRWGNFWSASFGWDIAKEKFMQDQTNWLDMLKFKASYGQNGSDNLGGGYAWYAYADQYQMTGADGVFSDGTLVYKGNSKLKWEQSNAFNIGFDYSFLHGMVAGSIDYFSRQTDNLLFNVPVAPSNGYSSMPMNIGSIRNSGLEFDVTYRPVDTKNITLDINANITLPSSKVLKLDPRIVDEDGVWLNGSRYFKEGEALYNMYLTEWAGVDPGTGYAMYRGRVELPEGSKLPEDMGDGKFRKNYTWVGEKEVDGEVYDIFEYDTNYYNDAYNSNRKATGNILPKAYGGFGFNLRVYDFDISSSFAYQLGGRIYDNTYASFMWGGTTGNMGRNWHQDILKAWTPENPNTDVPRLAIEDRYSSQNSLSTRFLTNSNYLSLNNITIGYTLPKHITERIGINELRVYGAAENVALWSKRKGLDPRQSYTAASNTNYSTMRSISGGIRVSF
ncbi:MAG: TonB-dependent receptor [Bacteroidales bacterium]|nr:TonB-dependent receptor [Bacteroidales bacterium]